MGHTILAEVIGAIGEKDFAPVAAEAVRRKIGFDLTAVIVHRPLGRPVVMFDNFDEAGSRRGMENYLRFTHRINPILAVPAPGACRARDFSLNVNAVCDEVNPHVVLEANEELGYRTIGWPERLEEIGLYFEACGGVVEFGFYRERAEQAAADRQLQTLHELSKPMAAAFERHGALAPLGIHRCESLLSSREQQVCELLLKGCSSEAVALRLGISIHTVKDHRKRIYSKLQVGSLAELFAWWRRVN